MTVRTYQPKKRHRARTHGFRARMATPGGRQVLKARRRKGRRNIALKSRLAKRIDWKN